jgi:hemoglobin
VTMAKAARTSITRRSVVAGLTLSAAPTVLAGADTAYAQAKQTTPDKSLYERLGGVFAIAAVVDHFSDAVVKNPVVGQKSKNPQLREWHTKNLGRLPGLRTLPCWPPCTRHSMRPASLGAVCQSTALREKRCHVPET